MLWDPINWLKIWMFYTFLTNSVQTPAGTLLYSTWLQMNFWEICVFHWVMDIWNCTFPISTIEIENYNGCKSLNMALGSHNLTWFGCLRPSCATWWRHRSGRDDSRLCSCTLPGCKRNLEKYVFYTEYWTISIAFFNYLYKGNWNFQMVITDLLLLWELGRHYLPTGTFLYSTWMQEKFWTICVLYSVVNIWNWTYSISTMQIEIFKWLNSLNIALGTWQRKPSDGDDPHQVHSCTLPNCEIMFK